ncbi:Cytochrome P450 2U1 [Hypsibius exemplaris]|uniref:Cytochrome P450 2U1 n=1 Tax=Hypsibius exemplaris TaxID=2072580 RepID=A0A1W0XDS8_HYPEX|nr:Cytochrome P450 2U1 [Hypsibius exemplaris]
MLGLLASWQALFLVAAFSVYIYFKWRRPKGVPPGPNGVPVLGYAPFLTARPHEKLLELSKTYGNIFTIYIGSRLTVILNDYEAVKTAYTDNADAFADRSPGFAHYALNGSDHDSRIRGLTMSNGDQWRTMRRFALTTLRDLGMGKSRLQSRILEEIDSFSATLKKKNLKPANPEHLMIACIANIMFAVTFDKRFEHDDQQFRTIMDFLTIALPTLSNVGPIQLFPWLRLIPGKFKKFWADFTTSQTLLRNVFRKELALHEKSHDFGQVQDYVGAFQDQREKELKQGNTNTYFDEDELIVELTNFFGAGAETTASTITWAYYFMVLHPDVQRKVQDVIDSKIGRDRDIIMEDKVNLTYVEAVCQEVQRLGNVVPLSIARSAVEDSNVLGFNVPKGSYIMPNLWNVHRDPRHWDAPEQFRPERFLDEEGRLLNPPQFMPFSIGKRHCPGESLAKMEVFLFVANILARFNLSVPRGYDLRPPEEYINGLTARPPPFEVIFTPR